MKHITGTGTVEPESSQTCVVYDAQTGRILHVHQVVTLHGGEAPTDHEIESRALALAANDRRQRSQMRVLHVNPESLSPGERYRVDLEKQALLSEPRTE